MEKSSENIRRLFLLRHAHRDEADYGRDNGLSEKGLKQAQEVADALQQKLKASPARLESSPKRRCLETLEPLAQKLGVSFEVSDELEERRSDEDTRALEGRIQSKIQSWAESKEPVSLFCSHGDWIPIALKQILDIEYQIKKAHWVALDFDSEGHWSLQELSP